MLRRPVELAVISGQTRARLDCQISAILRKNDLRSPQEKRAYHRMLRHLLSCEIQTYKEDQARPLPPQIADLLKTLLYPEQTETLSSSAITDIRDRRRKA